MATHVGNASKGCVWAPVLSCTKKVWPDASTPCTGLGLPHAVHVHGSQVHGHVHVARFEWFKQHSFALTRAWQPTRVAGRARRLHSCCHSASGAPLLCFKQLAPGS